MTRFTDAIRYRLSHHRVFCDEIPMRSWFFAQNSILRSSDARLKFVELIRCKRKPCTAQYAPTVVHSWLVMQKTYAINLNCLSRTMAASLDTWNAITTCSAK